jgi:glycosyltransferase involved in cell wall biosynthesis
MMNDSGNISLSAVVLARNEELHVERAVRCAFAVAPTVYVVDSYSRDNTVRLAKEAGASVVQHEFVTQSRQFQWALDNLPIKTEWVMRLDADETLSGELIEEIWRVLPALNTLRQEIRYPPGPKGMLLEPLATSMAAPIAWGGRTP